MQKAINYERNNYERKKKLKSKSKIIELKNNSRSSFYISTKKLEYKLNFKPQTTKKVIEKHLENFI